MLKCKNCVFPDCDERPMRNTYQKISTTRNSRRKLYMYIHIYSHRISYTYICVHKPGSSPSTSIFEPNFVFQRQTCRTCLHLPITFNASMSKCHVQKNFGPLTMTSDGPAFFKAARKFHGK